MSTTSRRLHSCARQFARRTNKAPPTVHQIGRDRAVFDDLPRSRNPLLRSTAMAGRDRRDRPVQSLLCARNFIPNARPQFSIWVASKTSPLQCRRTSSGVTPRPWRRDRIVSAVTPWRNRAARPGAVSSLSSSCPETPAVVGGVSAEAWSGGWPAAGTRRTMPSPPVRNATRDRNRPPSSD
jgi:hypothetical protein